MARKERRPRPPTLMDVITLASLHEGKRFDKRVREFHWRVHPEPVMARTLQVKRRWGLRRGPRILAQIRRAVEWSKSR